MRAPVLVPRREIWFAVREAPVLGYQGVIMSVSSGVLVAGLVIFTAFVLAISWRRRYHPRNTALIVAGYVLVLLLAATEPDRSFFAAKLLAAAIGGALVARGFERERVGGDRRA